MLLMNSVNNYNSNVIVIHILVVIQNITIN